MKNIVLIDMDCILIHSVIKSKTIRIDTLIVGSDSQKSELEKKYKINNILSTESINNFYTESSINLDYAIVEKFRHTQLKVEHFFSRKTSDINSIQYIYYCALSYWYERFNSTTIDAVFSASIEFGSTFDTIVYDVAKYNNKKVIIMEIALNNGINTANQILDYNTKQYLKVNAKENGLKVLDINKFINNSEVVVTKTKSKSFKEFLQRTPEKYGGYLIIMFVSLLMGKYKSIHHSFNTSYWTYFKNYFYTKKLLRYYNSLSVEFDQTKKYIYYSLHMEPEASTIVRTTFANQLVIIKTLSQSLPKGWMLYVKEHPHQFSKLNNFERYYYLSSIEKFKTKRYYDEIVKLPNVKLLSIKQNSQDVIKYSQAIATINGTVAIEAISMQKAILMFSQGSSPLIKTKEIYNVDSLQKCKIVLDRIQAAKKMEYLDFNSTMEDYFYEVSLLKDFDYLKLVENLILKEN